VRHTDNGHVFDFGISVIKIASWPHYSIGN
jgi:hypothetical protein